MRTTWKNLTRNILSINSIGLSLNPNEEKSIDIAPQRMSVIMMGGDIELAYLLGNGKLLMTDMDWWSAQVINSLIFKSFTKGPGDPHEPEPPRW